MSFHVREMTIDDHAEVYRLWSKTKGMALTDDDSREGIALYLRRNPGFCFVAIAADTIVGAVLCGHDGRRGILRHLAVVPDHRRRGIAQQLVQKCLAALAADGIRKCNIFVMDYNTAGQAFWSHLGAKLQHYDWRTFQLPTA